MKLLRPAILAVILAGAFFYFTTYRSGHTWPGNWISRPGQVEISQAAGNESLDSEEQNNISVYRKNIGSVVNITSRAVTFDFFYGLVPEEGQGSGFIIDKEGHILTNYHVIANARQVEVTLHNRKKYRAEIVGTDRSHDLAVIQIKAPEIQPMTLGDSANLQVGQKVYAIGNPFGLAGTLTRGIVSSIRSVQEPDGMTIDEDGDLYLCGPGVTIFDKTGKQIEHIDVPEPWTANVSFGGKDHKTLFITASKSLYSLQLRVKGANPAK